MFSYKGDHLIADVVERAKRYGLIEQTEQRYEERNCEDADVILVAYGLSSRACLEAVNHVKEQGLKVGLFRPITLWPFPSKRLAELAAQTTGILVVEQSLGQLVQDVKLAVGDKVPVGLNAYPAGGQPDGTQILTAAHSLLTGKKEGLFTLKDHAEGFTYNCQRDTNLGIQGDRKGAN